MRSRPSVWAALIFFGLGGSAAYGVDAITNPRTTDPASRPGDAPGAFQNNTGSFGNNPGFSTGQDRQDPTTTSPSLGAGQQPGSVGGLPEPGATPFPGTVGPGLNGRSDFPTTNPDREIPGSLPGTVPGTAPGTSTTPGSGTSFGTPPATGTGTGVSQGSGTGFGTGTGTAAGPSVGGTGPSANTSGFGPGGTAAGTGAFSFP